LIVRVGGDDAQVSWNVDMDPSRARSEQRGAMRFPSEYVFTRNVLQPA
jgi:hypothetical protein